jgi:hypothetical protein
LTVIAVNGSQQLSDLQRVRDRCMMRRRSRRERSAKIRSDIMLGATRRNCLVLAASQHELAQHFARSAPDKFAQSESEFEEGLGGCPRLRHSAATFECATYSRHTEGDHTIVPGRVDRHIRTTDPAIKLHQWQMGSLWDLAQSATDLSHSVK